MSTTSTPRGVTGTILASDAAGAAQTENAPFGRPHERMAERGVLGLGGAGGVGRENGAGDPARSGGGAH
ncbi:MAG: hypothetical protein ACHQ4G_01905, partial [Opitutales bacterium]